MPCDTVAACLSAVGFVPDPTRELTDLCLYEVRKSYGATMLAIHPDLGGSTTTFDEARAAFEVLREICYQKEVPSLIGSTSSRYAKAAALVAQTYRPPRAFFEAIFSSEHRFAKHMVEPAKSNRAKCKACGQKIPLGAVRIGQETRYDQWGDWKCLGCWNVPSEIWLGLPEPDTCDDANAYVRALYALAPHALYGVSELSQADVRELAEHVMLKKHWAKRSPQPQVAPPPAVVAAAHNATLPAAAGSRAIAPTAAASTPPAAVGGSALAPQPPSPTSTAANKRARY